MTVRIWYRPSCSSRPRVAQNRAARMLRRDRGEKILLLEYLPGKLIEGTPAESASEIYRQAGTMLAQLHAQNAREDREYDMPRESTPQREEELVGASAGETVTVREDIAETPAPRVESDAEPAAPRRRGWWSRG